MKISVFHPVYTKREAELPFYITTIGMSPEERAVYRPGGIGSYLLLYTLCGSGKVQIYGEMVDAPQGSLVIIPPNTTHYYMMKGEEWSTIWITFSGWAAKQFFDVDASVIPVPAEFDFSAKFNNLLQLRKNQEWNVQSSALLYSLLLECKELIPEQSVSAYKLKNQLKACLNHIHNNYMNVIELSQLADLSGVTREHLCRLFKQYTGMRPFEYITKIRMQKARELLAVNCEMSIAEIARQTGFQSSSYFSSIFRKNFGCSAEKYRNDNILQEKR